MTRKAMILFMATMLANVTIAAPIAVDAEKLDVVGVRLGMTP
jgi:hypothetical protein